MSLPRAPIAIRMPISRVRSVTETSMMFMIPMPPTTSETAATPPSSRSSSGVTPVTVSSRLVVVADREVVGLRCLELVARPQQVGDVGRHLGHLVGAASPGSRSS